MGVYYLSACHDCKEKTMHPKCPEESANEFHAEFIKDHVDHNTELGHDYNDEFYDRIWKYKSIPSAH